MIFRSPEWLPARRGLRPIQNLAARLQRSHAAGGPTWCIFDNTASGAALGNALTTLACLS
ncbi:hypothetical protein MD26_16695 [Pseudomonas sp. H2]|nr:hypothetical protein MD26_16695 [Pseudomonas sp. H2]